MKMDTEKIAIIAVCVAVVALIAAICIYEIMENKWAFENGYEQVQVQGSTTTMWVKK
jgi:hypothetical protein